MTTKKLDRLQALRRMYYELGEDCPDLQALLHALDVALDDAQRDDRPAEDDDPIELPRWVVREMWRVLARWLVDEDVMDTKRMSEGTRSRLAAMINFGLDRDRAKRRPREDEQRPHERARAMAPHRERWELVIWYRALGHTLSRACELVAEECSTSPENVKSSYQKVSRPARERVK